MTILAQHTKRVDNIDTLAEAAPKPCLHYCLQVATERGYVN
jgi:hypothetical protein